ncbi:hypothetical protein PIB30_063300 [Stylosanthes scabra]|uniref:Uncharacterized protein n=1 Tax=Stylosanthes scabra TaxID=79078 RepID=A0ABU6YIW9_9FABA|nr:hypothetical protein [Stylosanthes scabra]
MSSHPLITTIMDPHKTAYINHKSKGGMTINKGVGFPTNNLNTANPTTTIHHKIPKAQDTNLHIGGINVVEKGDEKKEKKDARTKWLIELIAKTNAMVESDDEDWWDESKESDDSDEEDSE